MDNDTTPQEVKDLAAEIKRLVDEQANVRAVSHWAEPECERARSRAHAAIDALAAMAAVPVVQPPQNQDQDHLAGALQAGTTSPASQALADSAYPTAKALEFAEYMAKRAEQFIDAFNAHGEWVVRREEGDDVDDDAMHDAWQSVIEHMRSLRSGIYEFRKRAAKAHESASAPVAGHFAAPPEAPGSNEQKEPS